MWLVFRRPHPRPSWPLRAALGFGRRQSSLRCFPILPSARPYVSANPTLRGGRLRQDPESETGAGDLPDPVTTLVLLRNRLPLAGSADYNPEAKPSLSAFVYKVLMEQSCEPAVCGLRLPLDTAAELIPAQTSGPTEGGAFPPSSPLSTSRRSR
nr:uncharacterized protein LOC117980802 [Pan paniscus]